MLLGQGLVLLGLLEHLIEGPHLYVGDGDFPLLHQVVLEGLHLNTVLGVHGLNRVNVPFVLFLGSLGKQLF